MSFISKFNSKSLSLVCGVALCGLLLASGVTREVPTGSIGGIVTLEETGQPFAKAVLTFIPKFSNPEQMTQVRTAECDKDGHYSVRNLAAGDYDIVVSSHAHELPTKRYTVAEGRMTNLNLVLKPNDPYMSLFAEQRVFLPEEAPAVKVEGFDKVQDFELLLYRVDFKHILASGGLYNSLSPLQNTSYSVGKDPIKVGGLLRKDSHRIENRDAEGVFVEYVKLPNLEPGVYWLNCRVNKMLRGTPLLVSDVALVTKRSDGDVRFFVTDLKSGRPISGAKVGVAVGPTQIPAGVTGADGTAKTVLTEATKGKSVVFYAQVGKSLALVDTQREQNAGSNSLTFCTYTDRPVYRPGDEFHFKTIVRRMTAGEYAMPSPGTATVEFSDPDGTLLDRKTVAVSEKGTLHGSFVFNKEASPGDYEVRVSYAGDETRRFVTCAAYRKPLYSITVTPEKSSYIRGETGRFTVQANYYYGGPVAGAKVQASVFRDAYWSPEIYGEDYDGSGDVYGSTGGQWFEDKEITTDSNGRAVVDFETVQSKDSKQLETDYVYTLNASITDESGQYFDGTGAVKVMRAAFGGALTVDHYAAKPGEVVKAKIQLKNHAGGLPVANKPVVFKTAYEFWNGDTTKELPSGTYTATTDSDGIAEVELKISRTGSLRVRALAEDADGNEVVESTWLWVDGEISAESRPLVDLSIKLDKPIYKAGDTARVVVISNTPGAAVLVTIEGAKIYEQRVLPMTTPSATIDFVVRDDFAPNVEVCACLVNNKRFETAQTGLKVDLGRRKLNVIVTSERDTYQPGETIHYSIKTTRADGTPTSAEVSLGVVDESIYALSADPTDVVASFYPRRYNRVETLHSFAEMYLDGGDKAPSSITVRRKFKDTAYWNPEIQTDAQGNAAVDVQLPDNLTTWRATAIAATTDTEVGMVISKAVARRPLMVRLEGPGFLTVGDTQQVSAFITNDTDKTESVKLSVEVLGARTGGDLSQEITVGAGKTESVMLTVEPIEAGIAKLTAKAWIEGGENDGVELVIPVNPSGTLERISDAGEFTDQKSINVEVASDADSKSGRLRLTITPSLASALVQALDDLVGYPYGCVEQTMSRFMPAMAVRQTFSKLGLPPSKWDPEIPQIAADSLVRLKRMQHESGMWGWWEYDEDDLRMTAYVLEGLSVAGRAGFATNKVMKERAVTASLKQLMTVYVEPRKPDGWAAWSDWKAYADQLRSRNANDRAYLTYAIALHGRLKEAKTLIGAMQTSTLSDSAVAYAVLSAQISGSPRLAELSNELMRRVIKVGALVHWKEDDYGVETTSRCFQAAWAVRKGSEIAPSVLRYLMLERRANSWASTRDTAVTVLSLTDYLAKTQELVGDSRLDILVNGAPFGSIAFNREALVNPNLVVDIPMAKLQKGANVVTLTKSDKSTAYFSLELNQYVTQLESSNGSVNIVRTYHRLETQPLEDGSMRFLPAKNPTDSFRAGDLVRVKVSLTVNKLQEYVLIEDPIPSGFRVTEREDPGLYEEWTWWYSRLQIFDDRVAIFVSNLEPGRHELEYTIRAETPGRATARATTAYPMYNPDARFVGIPAKVEIR